MRWKDLSLFGAGAVTGALALYYVLWRTDGLMKDHPLSRTTSDWSRKTAPLPPLATIPFPTPGRTPDPTPDPSPAAAGTTPAAPTLPTPSLEGFAELKGRSLSFPIEGYRLMDLKDSFHETRGGVRRHEALDILAPRGTPVLAVDEGAVVKLFTSEQGGLTVYQFDARERFCYYYAHLDRYAEGLREGTILKRGGRVGYVGTTGNARPDNPHLHFAIFRLGPEKRWWEGTALNPFPLFVAGPVK